jgi:1-aminocyclopropane-1-carboxylate deaminase/D-cysteine desulfhydrase-like pyridoxal-dependent ACC family enzyme
MTAAAARAAGCRAALVLTASEPARLLQGNLLLDRLFGAELHFIPPSSDPKLAVADEEEAKIAEVMEGLRRSGERPYLIPIGGSSAVGALGYVAGTLELVSQIAAQGESPTRLYYASGSRGTGAGLVLGARLFSAPYRPVGIAVSGGEPEKRLRAARIANGAAERLGVSLRVTPDDFETDAGYIGEGYGIPTPEGLEAIELMATHEGVLLDPVYTATAMAGAIDHVRRGLVGPGETIVFLHTGGVPALFAMTGSLRL